MSYIYSPNKGNFISLIILLKPSTSSVKFARLSSEGHHIQRRTIGSFEYKLSSFYTYLTALSFCDFFSCIFAILNVLEYIPPPYLDTYSMKYRQICLSISLYTHPIGMNYFLIFGQIFILYIFYSN